MTNTVLGHYPGYLNLAAKLHAANRFSIPKSRWQRMSPNARWSANTQFLQAAINANDCFCFSHHPSLARRGSYFFHELRFLRSRNVGVVPLLDAYIAVGP